MNADVELRPGLTPLIQWRAIYRGAPLALDPFARPDVEAGAEALAEIAARRDLPPPETDVPPLPDLTREDSGERLPAALVRLFVAVKLASLAQGASGMRWETLSGIGEFLAAGLLPAIPAEGTDDRLALADLLSALTGTGEVMRGRQRCPASEALVEADLAPLELIREERAALLSGNALSSASALAGLFETERIFHSALVAAALSEEALQRPRAMLHPRAHRLLREPGQMEVAELLAALRGKSAWAAAPPFHDEAAEHEHIEELEARRLPLRMGACLDLLRQAGATLERAANAVTEDRLVLWQSGEMIAGLADSFSAERAADVVALALVAICELSQARIAALVAAGKAEADGEPDRIGADARAAGFVARIREHDERRSGARRLLPMAGNAALVLAIELQEALRLSPPPPAGTESNGGPLADVLRQLREAARGDAMPGLGAAGDLAAIADRVGCGALAASSGLTLPGIVPRPVKHPGERAHRG